MSRNLFLIFFFSLSLPKVGRKPYQIWIFDRKKRFLVSLPLFSKFLSEALLEKSRPKLTFSHICFVPPLSPPWRWIRKPLLTRTKISPLEEGQGLKPLIRPSLRKLPESHISRRLIGREEIYFFLPGKSSPF